MKKLQIKVDEVLDDMRLDLVWVKANIGLSRRKIRQIIDGGGASHNGKRVRMSSQTVSLGDTLVLQYDPEAFTSPKTVPVVFRDQDILYRDPYLLAVNKPPFMLSQATKNKSAVYVEAALKGYYRGRDDAPKYLQICHRLDKETSGVLLVATDKLAADFIMDEFRERNVKKIYHAIVYGIPPKKEWEVKCQLSSIDKKTGLVKVVRDGGKLSNTRFRVLQVNKKLGVSFIECSPLTGRSHQLRVHLESKGLPIIGDKKYGELKGGDNLPFLPKHHLLHARSLSFRARPGGESILVEADYPEEFTIAIKKYLQHQ